jgi:poly(A) polymerase
MDFLGLQPGPQVGEALGFLLELRLDEGPLGKEEAYRRLKGWAEERGLGVRG